MRMGSAPLDGLRIVRSSKPDANRQLAERLQQRPLLVVIAGSNGAGKTTFYESMLRPSGLRFVNADVLVREIGADDRQGAALADALRAELIRLRESFITETVFSDPVGAKIKTFSDAITAGYQVLLIFIAIGSPERSDERVALRVSQGGHDVPPDRIQARFPRTLANLRRAIPLMSAVLVYDNDDLLRPYRLIAQFDQGHVVHENPDLPAWWLRFRSGR